MMGNHSLHDKLLISERRVARLEELAEKIKKTAIRDRAGLRESWIAAESLLLRGQPSGGTVFTPLIYTFTVVDCGGNPLPGATVIASLQTSGVWVDIGPTDSDGHVFYYADTADKVLLQVSASLSGYGSRTATAATLLTLALVPPAPSFCLCARMVQPDQIVDHLGSTTLTESAGLWVATTTMNIGFKWQVTGGSSSSVVTAGPSTITWTFNPATFLLKAVYRTMFEPASTGTLIADDTATSTATRPAPGTTTYTDSPRVTNCGATPETIYSRGASGSILGFPQQYDLDLNQLWTVTSLLGNQHESDTGIGGTNMVKITFKEITP